MDGPSLEYMDDFEDDEDEFLSDSSQLSDSDSEVKAEDEEPEVGVECQLKLVIYDIVGFIVEIVLDTFD